MDRHESRTLSQLVSQILGSLAAVRGDACFDCLAVPVTERPLAGQIVDGDLKHFFKIECGRCRQCGEAKPVIRNEADA